MIYIFGTRIDTDFTMRMFFLNTNFSNFTNYVLRIH